MNYVNGKGGVIDTGAIHRAPLEMEIGRLRAHAAALARALWEVRGLWADHVHHRPDCQLERRAGPCDCRAGAAAKRADAALAAYEAEKGAK